MTAAIRSLAGPLVNGQGENGALDDDLRAWPEAPTRRPNRHEEDRLHTSIWRDLQRVLPPEVVVWSVENRFVGPDEGARRKARGVVAGQPDMTFHWPHGLICYVEIKTPKGVVSDAQKALHERLRAAGIPVAVCRSTHDVLVFLDKLRCPLRVRL